MVLAQGVCKNFGALKVLKGITLEVAKGTSTVRFTGLRAGAYAVRVSATDLAGNTAGAPKRARVTIRS